MSTLGFVIAGFIFLAIVCIFLVRYYSGAFVTKDVVLSVYLSWVLGLAGILLLPYDISVTLVEQIHSKILDDVWKFVYWSTFILAWLVLPIQMEYHNSGHFTVTEKLFDAIRHNILMGSLAAVAAIVYIIYMVSTTGGSFSEVIGFMMAMGNTYGVLLIIFLMGNGLAALPRRLWQLGDDSDELIRLYISVNGVEGAYQEARYALEDCEHDVQEAVETTINITHIDPKIVAYIDVLQDKVANFHFTGRSTSRQHLMKSKLINSNNNNNSTSIIKNGVFERSSNKNTVNNDNNKLKNIHQQQQQQLASSSKLSPVAAVWTDKKALVSLHSRLIQAQTRAGASDLRWKGLVKKITALERYISVCAGVGTSSVIPSHSPPPTSSSSSSNNNNNNNNNSYPNSIITKAIMAVSYVWSSFIHHEVIIRCQLILLKYKKYVYRFLSICACLLSVSILWSELVLSTSLHSPTGSLIGAYNNNNNNIIHYNNSKNIANNTSDPNQAFFVQLVTFITLAYMSLCTYWSLFRLNLGWAYNLQGPQQSTPSSLIFNGEYFSRLQFPLGYNFLMTINANSMKSTSFYGMMQNITLIPVFGTSFTVFVPLLMILVAVATLLNVFQRLLNILGIETEDPVGGSLCFCCASSRNSNHHTNGNNNKTSSSSPSSSSKAIENTLSHEDMMKFESGRTLVRNEVKQTAMLILLQESSSRGGGSRGINRSASINSDSALVEGGSGSRGSSIVGHPSPTRANNTMMMSNNSNSRYSHNHHHKIYNYDEDEENGEGNKRIDDDDDEEEDDDSYNRYSSFYNGGDRLNLNTKNNTQVYDNTSISSRQPSSSSSSGIEFQSLRSQSIQQPPHHQQQSQPFTKQQLSDRHSLFGNSSSNSSSGSSSSGSNDNRRTNGEYQPVVIDESIAITTSTPIRGGGGVRGGDELIQAITRNPLQSMIITTPPLNTSTINNNNNSQSVKPVNNMFLNQAYNDDDDDDEDAYGGRYSNL